MADQQIILVDASVEVDDVAWTLKGNTLKFKEGQGEYTTTGATKGGRAAIVHSMDINTRVSEISFETPASVDSMDLTRDTKALGPGRVVVISGMDGVGNRMSRTMTQGVMSDDPEKTIQNEGMIAVTFRGAPLVAG
jgi:hypothetical protein